MKMYDPFEPHPEMLDYPKKPKNILTLGAVCDTIDKQIEAVKDLCPGTWGFSRENIIEALEDIKEKLKEKAQND
jgi:hypothetical protein